MSTPAGGLRPARQTLTTSPGGGAVAQSAPVSIDRGAGSLPVTAFYPFRVGPCSARLALPTLGFASFIIRRTDATRTPRRTHSQDFDVSLQAVGTIPQDAVELIGEQKTVARDGKTSGIFNFYAVEAKQWKFFGSSASFMSQGYECNGDGACIPKAATKQRCAACHSGGGLVMKELNAPWINWEGDMFTPGVTEVIAKRPDLFGTQGDGADLQGSVENGNTEWTPARIAALRRVGLKEVLRPLFCTTEINIASVPAVHGMSYPKDLFVELNWPTSIGGELPGDKYAGAIKEIGQVILDSRTGKPLAGAGGVFLTDTVVPLTYPTRATAEMSYADELKKEAIVDDDFVKDVLAIDFTRPIYSPTRCALAELAPTVAESEMNPAKIKAAWATALAGKTEPAAVQLLASIQNTNDAANHDADVATYGKACVQRMTTDPVGMLADTLKRVSHLRTGARNMRDATSGGIIEFLETLPTDNLPDTAASFDAVTCTLK